MDEPTVPPCDICGAPSIRAIAICGDNSEFHKFACQAHMDTIEDQAKEFQRGLMLPIPETERDRIH